MIIKILILHGKVLVILKVLMIKIINIHYNSKVNKKWIIIWINIKNKLHYNRFIKNIIINLLQNKYSFQYNLKMNIILLNYKNKQ